MIQGFAIVESSASSGGAPASVLFSAGTLSSLRSDITFSNSNGVTFGLETNGVITASVATAGGGALTNIKVSAGTLSALRSDLTFNNSNGVSFGLDGAGVITATVATNYAGTSTGATNASVTLNTAGIAISVAAPGAANINISAGTTSTNATAFTFSNANSVSFGLGTGANAGVITASVPAFLTTAALSQDSSKYAGTVSGATGPISITVNTSGVSVSVSNYLTTAMASNAATISNINVSAGTTSTNASAFTFNNANGVSFGLGTGASAGSITASIATTYAGTGFTSTTTAGTAVVGTLNTSGLSLGVPAFLTTAMQSNAATISNINISAGTTSTNGSAFTFANANGVSFGLAGGASTDQITASIATTYAGTGFTSTTTAGTAIVGTLNTSGLSLGVPAFLTTAALSSQTLAFSLGGNSATTNSSQILNGGYILAGGANVTIQQSNNTISISAASAAAAPVQFSAGTTSQNLGTIFFSNANGVSFGLNTGASSSVMTASAAGGVALANSQTTFSTGTVNLLEGGGAITIASSAGGQSFKFSVPQTSSLVGVNPVSISTNGSTISVMLNNLSYWANFPAFQNTTTTMAQSNSFYVCPLTILFNISASYLRLLASFNFTSTTIATTAVNNATGASTAFSETMAFNAVVYSVGAGASSRSLQHYFSTSAGLTWAASVSQASTSNATNQSITQAITFPREGNTTDNVTTQYSVSATNGAISTTQWSNLSAQRFLDIPFATSLSAGNYWLALNRISGTVGGKNLDCNATTFGRSQQNLSFGVMNSATNLSNCPPQMGLGLWTTNTAQTTSSIAFASISATTSHMIPFVQFIRQA